MKLQELLEMSTMAYKEFVATGDRYRAMLTLPLGTKMQMSGQGGLRDAIYMLELRYGAEGANFEYRDQAGRALIQLAEALGPETVEWIGLLAPSE